jgi:hypothetical protein
LLEDWRGRESDLHSCGEATRSRLA